MARYDADELWALLIAAGASPSVRHKWVRVGYLGDRVAKLNQRVGKPVERQLLHELLEDAASEIGRIESYEDYLPEDPRDDVRVSVVDRVFRLGPGEVERPVADVDRALIVADAIDPFLIDRKGFGVLDVVEVILAYQDAAIHALAGSWPAGEVDLEGPTAVAPSEVDAARRLVALGTPPAVLPTERHERAIEWLTCSASELSYDPNDRQSPVGRFVRVRDVAGAEARWLPLCLLPGALGYALTELAAEVADVPDARRRFAEVVATEVRECLWRFGGVFGPPDVDGVPRVSPRNVVQWVLSRTPRHSLLVQVVSDLRADMIDFSEEPEALRASRAAASGGPGPIKVRMALGDLTLKPGAEAVPLLVVATPSHVAVLRQPGLPGVSLDDLRWIAATAESASDLFNYCRDMARPDLPYYMGWEAIDCWEWWRSNAKSFFSGGLPPEFISIAPHWGTAEWRRAAKKSELEVVLARLGLPPLRRLHIDPDDDDEGPRAVAVWEPEGSGAGNTRGWHARPPVKAWTVHVGRVPVAVTAVRPDWPSGQVEFLSNLAVGLAYALEGIATYWEDAHQGTGVHGYVINMSPRNAGGQLLAVGQTSRAATAGEAASELDGDVVSVDLIVDKQPLRADGVDATAAFQEAIATVISAFTTAAGVDGAAAEEIATAILDRAPTFAVEAHRPTTARNDLRLPVELDEALLSVVDRKVAEAVRAAGVEPGEYRGDDAKALDRDVLAPAALNLLNNALAIHGIDDVLLFGMEQLERCLARKSQAQLDARQAALKLNVSWDPVARYQKLEGELITLRRCIEAALEAVLRSAPSGTVPVDEVAWGELLAAARGYLDATSRSEAIHHQVSPTVLKFSTSFELSTRSDETSTPGARNGSRGLLYDFDSEAYGRSRVEGTVRDQDPVDVEEADKASPVPADLDDAMLQAFGASATDVFTVLTAVAGWPLDPTDPDAFPVGVDAVVDHVLECTADPGHKVNPDAAADPDAQARTAAAVRLLTSTTADLFAADWKPWQARSRKRRILIQPFAQMSDGRLVVSPRLCLATASIYLRYLVQGQLPWSQPAPPRVVNKALEAVRERRNKALEVRVASLLGAEDWKLIANVKETKPERLNVPTLRTEIDVVAGRAGDPNLWLLEVKDPAEVFALADVRRLLDRLFLDEEKKPAYATQLRKKLEDLSPHAARIATALGLPTEDPASPYQVRPLFVTREPTPAQFVTGPFPFTSLARLVDRLENPEQEAEPTSAPDP